MYIIRQATKEDITTLTKLRIELLLEVGDISSSDDHSVFINSLIDYLNMNLGESFFAWIAEEDGRIIATSGLNIFDKPPAFSNISGREGYIMNIYVIEECRRQGIATQLMKRIIEYCGLLQIQYIKLNATKEGKPIYQKLGFIDYDGGMLRKNIEQ